jgi:leucyl aminopeptidase (aminopeptidase T)
MLSVKDLMPTARQIVEETLGVQPGELATIVTDFKCPKRVTMALARCLRHLGAEVTVVTMSPRDRGGIDPPVTVAGAMSASRVIVTQTSFGMFHTDTVRETLARGGRVCEFWGVTEDMMVRGGLTENPVWLEKTTRRLAELMDKASEARLETPNGTDLRIELKGRRALALAGTARSSGSWCSLPAGEAVVCPVEGSSHGKLVEPYLVEHRDIRRPREPLELTIRSGNVTEVKGGREAQRLRRLLDEIGPSARNIAEFALGTNRRCRIETGLREAKKTWGTAHVGIGDSKSLGGTVESPLHVDFVFVQPTVWLDEHEVVREGRLRDL